MTELKLLKEEGADAVGRRAEFLFESHQRTNLQRTDRLFAGLMLFQWVARACRRTLDRAQNLGGLL
jgi:hypothetical protein